jgi:hypothetical protein
LGARDILIFDPMSMHKLNSLGNRKVGKHVSICITNKKIRMLIIIVYKRKKERKSNAFFFIHEKGFQKAACSWSCSKPLDASHTWRTLTYIAIRLMWFVQHQSARVFGGYLLLVCVYQVDPKHNSSFPPRFQTLPNNFPPPLVVNDFHLGGKKTLIKNPNKKTLNKTLIKNPNEIFLTLLIIMIVPPPNPHNKP